MKGRISKNQTHLKQRHQRLALVSRLPKSHRIGLTRHNLAAVMAGDIDDVIVACRTFFQAEALRQQQAQA